MIVDTSDRPDAEPPWFALEVPGIVVGWSADSTTVIVDYGGIAKAVALHGSPTVRVDPVALPADAGPGIVVLAP